MNDNQVSRTENQDRKIIKTSNIENWLPNKERISHNFIDNKQTIQSLTVNAGDIFECEIGENVGEEQCNTRPVLIVSKSFYNNHSSQVTVVPLSTSFKTKVITRQGRDRTVMKIRTHYRLRKNEFEFLNADSAVKCEQIRSVSKSRLNFKLGSIDEVTLRQVRKRIIDLLDL